MFSTLSDYIFGPSPSSSPDDRPETAATQGDDWVVVKDEEKSFLLSTEVVTRNRVNLQEDLSRENFLIEHPLSLSSEEIQMRKINIGRKKKRKVKCENKTRLSKDYLGLADLAMSEDQSVVKPGRVLTLNLKNNNRGQGQSLFDKRRESYHYKRYSGCNNDRKCGRQRS